MSENPKQQARRIEKPWGYELIWAQTNAYVGKILFIKAGESLSLQYHRIKEETMYIELGECIIEVGASEKELRIKTLTSGDLLHLPPGTLHRLTAKSDCRIFEVSTPHLDDVVRLKDKYGRS